VRAIDNRELSLLVLLDLSAAFDTVDRRILLNDLENPVCIQDAALDSFRSYLTGHRHTSQGVGGCSPQTRAN